MHAAPCSNRSLFAAGTFIARSRDFIMYKRALHTGDSQAEEREREKEIAELESSIVQ